MESNSVEQQEVQTVRKDIIDLLAKRVVDVVITNADKPIQQIRESLPKDVEQIRSLPLYNITLEALQWQRDNYLVGTKYAEERRQKLSQKSSSNRPVHHYRIPYDATALGCIQIINLGSWFIPSPTVKDALLPIVLTLPSGVLKEPITNSVVNAIPLAQPSLDRAMKSSILDFMQNPYWREVIKNRTKGYMGYRE